MFLMSDRPVMSGLRCQLLKVKERELAVDKSEYFIRHEMWPVVTYRALGSGGKEGR